MVAEDQPRIDYYRSIIQRMKPEDYRLACRGGNFRPGEEP